CPALAPFEAVPPAVEPVGPRRKHLPTAGGRPLVGGESVDDVDAPRRVAPERRAHLSDDGDLIASPDLVLTAGRRRRLPLLGHGAPSLPCVREASPAPESAFALEMSARWVNACGKLPISRLLTGSYSSEKSPRSFRSASSRSKSSSASFVRPIIARSLTNQK